MEGNAATGVRLIDGETIRADWVISAADGHATIYDLLGGKFTDKVTDRIYRTLKTFPSYLQVSFGVARDLSQLARIPDAHSRYSADRRPRHAALAAPPSGSSISTRPSRLTGKTAVTCFLPTGNFDFWVNLRQRDPARYQAEKDRVAEAVIAILERIVPDLRLAIEVIDVSTPATVIRQTGNWKGSMEGWLLTPETGFRPLRIPCPACGIS